MANPQPSRLKASTKQAASKTEAEMEWLNLHTSTLDHEDFLGADVAERGTWLCLLRYCIGQENGGKIQNCQEWKDRKWQQIVRVTKDEAMSDCDLWEWVGDDLILRHYPAEKERMIQAKREAGRKGGKASGKQRRKRNESTDEADVKQNKKTASTEVEGEGEVERKDKEKGKIERERGTQAREDGESGSKIEEPASQLLAAAGFRSNWATVSSEAARGYLEPSSARLLTDPESLKLLCDHVAAWIQKRESGKDRYQDVSIAELGRNITNIYEFASKREKPSTDNDHDKFQDGF